VHLTDENASPLGDGSFVVTWNAVTPGYFGTLRIPILRGRDFGDADTATSEPVVIISARKQRLSHHHFSAMTSSMLASK
jgi:hypothetical protein